MQGNNNKALELYRMINPIEHSRTKESANKYKVEPYVISADIYGVENLAGRGGWTWYTGSSSWYYITGIEYILGMKIQNNVMHFEPCVPSDWKGYGIQYKYEKSVYNIFVKNLSGEGKNVKKFFVNGKLIEEKEIKLDKSGKIFEINIEI